MTRTTMRAIFRPQALAAAVALGCCAQAQAVSFNIGEIEGQFDSSLSVGASWGMRDADKKLVGIPNGGTGQASTGDDGRLNFKKGETFSKIFKGIHDLELKYGDSGVFVRGKYWYDFELQDEDREFKQISNNHRDEGARSSGYELLDAFVYHNYSIGDLPGNVRVGKQVVSWGESTFIGNSINSINPIDVSAFRRPGAEIKEGLIPVNMVFASQSLTNQLSVEGFYQLNWENTVVDNCGTFFGNDVVAHGCNGNYTVGSPAIAPLQPVAAAFGQGFQVTSTSTDFSASALYRSNRAAISGNSERRSFSATTWMKFCTFTSNLSPHTSIKVAALSALVRRGALSTRCMVSSCDTAAARPSMADQEASCWWAWACSKAALA